MAVVSYRDTAENIDESTERRSAIRDENSEARVRNARRIRIKESEAVGFGVEVEVNNAVNVRCTRVRNVVCRTPGSRRGIPSWRSSAVRPAEMSERLAETFFVI